MSRSFWTNCVVTSVLFLSLGLSAYAMTSSHRVHMQNTVSFNTKASTDVKTDKALVQVTVHATAMNNSKDTLEQSAISQLTNAVPKSDWKVVNYQQSQAASGVTNITMELQSRLTQGNIKLLQKGLSTPTVLNQKYDMKVLNYNPTPEMIEAAKQKLMVTMYQSLQKQLSDFNQATHSNYFIQNVNFNEVSPYTPRVQPMVLMAEQNTKVNSSKQSIKVSHEITLTANVTFAENQNSTKASSTSPVAYTHQKATNWPA